MKQENGGGCDETLVYSSDTVVVVVVLGWDGRETLIAFITRIKKIMGAGGGRFSKSTDVITETTTKVIVFFYGQLF